MQGSLHEHNLWVYGQAGIGKTSYYIDYFSERGGIYDKDKSKYWNCYNNEVAVLIDDVEKSDGPHMLGLLKRWCQHKPFLAEDKYGTFTTIRPRHMIITSNYPPADIWPDIDIEPITRRLKVVHFTHLSQYYPEGHPKFSVPASSFIPGVPDVCRCNGHLDLEQKD